MIEPVRLLRGWDIMNLFNAHRLMIAVDSLAQIQAQCGHMERMGFGNRRFDDRLHNKMMGNVNFALELCTDAQLLNAAGKIRMSLHTLNDRRKDVSGVGTELRNIFESIVSEIAKHKFINIAEDKKSYVDTPALFGQRVADCFPSAAFDIKEAGNCYAVECNTACVFHLMRGVEWALRALCVHLGVRQLRTKDRKTGKISYSPLEWQEWNRIIEHVKSKVHARIAKLRREPKKQIYQEFYLPALEEIESIKDAWRNHVMHTRRQYNGRDAEAILSHVNRLMATLSERLSEV
jgi:hypothetical protein